MLFSFLPIKGPPIIKQFHYQANDVMFISQGLSSRGEPASRVRRIRLYEIVNIESILFAVCELQEVPGERYHPSREIFRNFCKKLDHGSIHPINSPRYFYSFVEKNIDDGQKSEEVGPRVVVQMDTESSTIYEKTCLDYYFDEPIQVSGDVRVVFYEKKVGGRLFYTCFNTSFIKNSLVKGKAVAGPGFCLELFFDQRD